MITDILFYSTIVLNFAGFIFACVFLWINIYGKYTDMEDRGISTLRIARISMIISIVFAFLICLFVDSEDIFEALSNSSLLYSIIAITWLAVVLICGITMLITVVSKRLYKPSISLACKKLFKISIPGALVCLFFTWLFF